MTLSTLLSERAKNIPGRTCIKFGDRKISYSEMDKRVSGTAGGLAALGLHAGDRVAILMDNCPEYIISYFAIIRAGGVAVPVNTFLMPDEISYILKDSGCGILIYSSRFHQYMEKLKNSAPDLVVKDFEGIPEIKTGPYQGADDNVAVLLYTSGTTGFPKGAMLTHGNLISNAGACNKVMQLTQNDRIMLFLPLFHSFSFTVCVILPVYAGAQIILLASVKPFSKVIKSIFKDRITFFVAVPTVYAILAKKKIPFLPGLLFRSLIKIRACVSGAAALPEDTLHAFEKRFGVPLIEGYGLTEASPVVAVNPLKGVRKPGSVGPPLPGIEVAVIGEAGDMLSHGEVGELIVRGPNVMKGYFNRKEETEAVLKDGWLYTGDLAKTDGDGYIYVVDRKKDLIIVDGMNVYPRETEDLVMKHPCVEECAMVGIPDGKGSEITVLFVRKKENAVVEQEDIRNYMKGRLAQFKIPRKIVFVESFQKTATGKIKKTELRRDPAGQRQR
ncbi:MAG: long-chain fatty acid--CoA ligase [Nitrospiraceae bacterium]|nr:MAG: long-chain fatty acid--CoA ligase [Nitrospiraceae bacterium]